MQLLRTDILLCILLRAKIRFDFNENNKKYITINIFIQMDIATTLLEYGAQADAESKAGFTPLHLSAQEGHSDMSSLLLEHQSDPNHAAKVLY